jgi:transcriptional regulator with XRE-family HTH domain
MKREELLKNKGYWISKIQIDLYNQLEKYMRENNINRTQFAEKLGVSKGYLSQVLNGDFNHRLSKLVELSLAIGKVPEFCFKDLEQIIQYENDGLKTISWSITIKKPNIEEIVFDGYSSQNTKKTEFDSKSGINDCVANYS